MSCWCKWVQWKQSWEIKGNVGLLPAFKGGQMQIICKINTVPKEGTSIADLLFWWSCKVLREFVNSGLPFHYCQENILPSVPTFACWHLCEDTAVPVCGFFFFFIPGEKELCTVLEQYIHSTLYIWITVNFHGDLLMLVVEGKPVFWRTECFVVFNSYSSGQEGHWRVLRIRLPAWSENNLTSNLILLKILNYESHVM